MLRRILSTQDPVWPSFEALLYRSFPPEEIESPEDVREQLDSGQGQRCLVWEPEPGRAAALVRARVLPQSRAAWIVHLVLEAEHRGRGRGAVLIHQTAEILREEEPRLRGFLMEVERLEDAAPDQMEGRAKRLAFFGRLGARLLTPSYIQPPAFPGAPPVPLNLFWLSMNQEDWGARELIEAFHHEAFGMDACHPDVQRAVMGAVC